MTVLDNAPRDQYTATSGQTVFPYTFEIAAAGDIKVLQNGILINQGAGAGEYAVSGVGVDTGGNVTLVTGATSGDIITIYRDMAYERLTAYTNAGDFLAADVNNDFDRLWLALQQNGGNLDRVLIAPNTDPTSIDMTIPDKATRLGKYLKFNDTTGNPEVGSIAGAFTAAGMNHYNFTGDGATVNFTLGMEPGGENNTQVYIDGVYQQKDTYNVSGAVLQFSTAPPNLSTIEVMVIQVLPVGATTASQVSFTQAGSTYGRNVQLKLQESVSVMDFGATGDGVTDDTAAIQAAFSAANNKTLYLPDGNYLVTSQINLPASVMVFGAGRFTFTGDQDYWLKATSATSIVFYSLIAEVTLAFGSRTNLNRVLFVSDAEYVEIKSAKITGASTAIDTSNGDALICGDIRLFNVLGTAAQYGYGINSSSKRTQIQNLYIKNDDTTNGRHGIYINGNQWEFFSIDNIWVNNFNKNPIQITNTGTGNNCFAFVGNAVFQSCNYSPTALTTGCIHVPDGGSTATIKLHVHSLRVDDVKGPAFGSVYAGLDNLYIGRIYAENLPQAASANTDLVYSRYGDDRVIDKIYVNALNTDWNSALNIRDATDFTINDIYVGGSAGDEAITINNSSVTIGHLSVDSITEITQTGATIHYKELQQNFEYGGAAPVSGTYAEGDIVWDTSPSAGGHIGWVCVTAGTPGTWKTFGAITA